ncbi:tetratricopeptide repeat protein [Owenweeksia hongkongensis]|uniref:tetratricopeptide repeat protein n=1 Tax=Owenweeksia hongkongensis TaxID=253245 RepID=UPI003A8EE3EA
MVNHRMKALGLSVLMMCAMWGNGQTSAAAQDIGAQYENGLELFRKGQYGNAQRLLDDVAEEEYYNDRETRASAAYYAAICAMKLYNSDAESRVDAFAREFELSPLSNRLYFEYANARFSLKRYRDAAEYFEKVDKYRLSKKQLNEYYFKKGYSFLETEQIKEAKSLFFELKDKDSKYASSAKYYYAHLLYTDSNYTEALANFLPLQGDQSFGPLVPYYLAHIYYELKDFDKLLEVGEELIENATPTRAPEIAKLMGDAFYTREDYENAAKYLEIFKEKGGRMRQRDHFELGYAQYKMKKYPEAINSFNKITGGDEALQQNAYYHLGDCYLKVGNKQSAITAFKAASEITASPTIREDAYFNYAKLVYENSDPYTDAISVLNGFMDEFPNSPYIKEGNRYLANLYITTKDYERALQAISRTGMDSPAMREAYQKIAFYRGSELFGALKYTAALNKYNESLEYPINQTITALSKYWKGETYYRLAEYDKALDQFESFRGTAGSFNMSEYNLSLYQTGYCYYKKFDFQKAATNFRTYTKEAKKNDPRLPDAYLRMADSYLLTGGYLVASEFYQSALKAGTKEADYALFQRAECLGLARKKDEKIAQLQQLLNKYPSSIYAENAQYEIAVTELQMEKYDKALASLNGFINEKPQSNLVPKAYLQKGLAYSNTDRNNEAIGVYKKVVSDYPGSEESIEAVGLARLVYARQNDIDGYLDWVSDLDFVNFSQSALDSTAYSAAFDQYSAGNCTGAISALSNYVNRFPKGLFSLKANYYLADCADRNNNTQQAAEAYERIVAMGRSEYTPEAVHYLANKAFTEKDYPEALKLFDQLAQVSDSRALTTQAQAGTMRSAFALGDYNKAAVYAELILENETQDAELVQVARRIAALGKVENEQWEEARPLLRELIASSGGEVKAEAFYNLALVNTKQKNYETSKTLVYQLIEELPDYKEWKMKGLILLAENFWYQDDIFQANYTLDFVISQAYSAEVTNEAQSMKDNIALMERQAVEEKKAELQKQSDSLMLDDGLMIIDESQEPADSLR